MNMVVVVMMVLVVVVVVLVVFGVAFLAPLIPAPLIPWEKIVRLRSGAHSGARSRPKKPRLRD